MEDTTKQPFEGLTPNQLRSLAEQANDEERYEEADELWRLANERSRPTPVDAETWLRRPEARS